MKCNQCGKTTEQSCQRDDCGYQASALSDAKRRLHAETTSANLRAANANFQQNFNTTMQWAVREGLVRKRDVETLWHFAKQSSSAPSAYLAIVRSL
mgnify:CR=1 FL=1